jgi:phage terminase large subunit-like protein
LPSPSPSPKTKRASGATSRNSRGPREPASLSYAERATRYAEEVVDRKIIACKQVRQACQRHLADLRQSRSKEFVYRYDATKADHVCRFIEQLPHTKGQWARQRPGHSNKIKLEPWQLFIVCSIFGWVEKQTGFRKYSEAYICVPRKNAKSTLAAAIGLYMLCADGEYGAEIYSGATKEKQAMEVFRPALLMAKKTPQLQKWFGIECAVKSLYREEDGSRFEPVVGNPGDGASPSCAIVDEYHEHETTILHDTMQTGMGAREQGLLLVITTAGSNIDGPCHILQGDVEKMLDGLVENENLFGIIYTVTVPEELVGTPAADSFWKTEDALRMANPNFGVSVFAEFLLKALRQAIQSAHKQNVFKTKHLNIWVNAATAWMNMDAFRGRADSTLKIEDFKTDPCYEGVDLAAKIDLASRCKVFTRSLSGKLHYYAFAKHYIPMERAMDGDHPHYEKWVHEDKLTGVPGPEIQLEEIQDEILAEYGLYDTRCIAFDRFMALQMIQKLEKSVPEDVIAEIPQTVEYLSPAMRELEAAVLAGRFHYDGDPVMTWAASNVIAREDANEGIFPRKEKHGKNKIDPMSALFNAISRAMHDKGTPKQSAGFMFSA